MMDSIDVPKTNGHPKWLKTGMLAVYTICDDP